MPKRAGIQEAASPACGERAQRGRHEERAPATTVSLRPLTKSDQSEPFPPKIKLSPQRERPNGTLSRQLAAVSQTIKSQVKVHVLSNKTIIEKVMEIIQSPNKDRLLDVTSDEWRQAVRPITWPWQLKMEKYFEFTAQLKKSRIGADIRRFWLPQLEIRLAGAIAQTFRCYDGVTEAEIREGIKTVRRMYRAHCRQLDCLQLLYSDLGEFKTTDHIMTITIIDEDPSTEAIETGIRYSYVRPLCVPAKRTR